MRVLISGTCPRKLNTNYELIAAIADGFRTHDGLEVTLATVNQLPEGIKAWKPQLVLLVGGLALETIPLALLHHLCSVAGSKFAFWNLEDPYEMDWVLQEGEFFDLICTTDFSSYCFYPGAWRVEHLPLAAPDHPAPQAGNRLPASARWLFCGVPFHNRINWIDSIRHTHPDGLLIGPNWPSYRHPTQVSRKRISRETLLSLYKTMPITLSIGRRHNIANSAKISPSTPGPRIFEAAGCGAVQLVCDSGLEIGRYYQPNYEFLWARSAEEACECLDRASKEPAMLKHISKRAWERTQSEHLYSHRANAILTWISEF